MTIGPLPHFLHIASAETPSPRQEVLAGLQGRPAQVSPKFLYDRLGSALFVAITELHEYYPTRTEAAIFAQHLPAMAALLHRWLPVAPNLVDLGAGNGAKAARLFSALRTAHYVAVDIAVDHLQDALNGLQGQHPAIRMTGVGLDFSNHLALPAGLCDGPSLVFYPGSSIGNFAPDEALRFLRRAHALSNSGALLIGADLCKAVPVLEAAYDDALGVTAAFNLNLLRHLNRLTGSDFVVRQWQHIARYDAEASRIEMHLQAREDVRVCWPGGERRFAAGERIHTENSYKWQAQGFEALLRDAGWHDVHCWTDPDHLFGVFLARA